MKLGTTKRIQSILTGIIDEFPLQNVPLNFDTAFICSSIKSHVPDKRNFVYAMKKLGYNAIQTYYNPKYWKTDAPPEVLYDVFKAYKIEMCGGDKEKIMANLKDGTVGWRIF
mgnify:CR=1 FL=1